MSDKPRLGRRRFLQGAALGGAAAAATPVIAQTPDASSPAPGVVRRTPPTPSLEETMRPVPDLYTQSSSGGDFMVDCMRGLGIEYVAATPGDSFKGLHESIINYGMTSDPKLTFITTMHEEASVAMAHGYAKIEGKPMACMMHAAVGLQHGSMAIYNAWCDRVPIFMISGANLDATRRGDKIDWLHAVNDGPGLVRDYTKWDDTPPSLQAFSESAARAYKFAMTPPYGPVLLAVDKPMQEGPLPEGRKPTVTRAPRTLPPQADDAGLRELAKALVQAENPVLVADRAARTPKGLMLMVELAELLQAAVIDMGARMNFPWRHPLNQSARRQAVLREADLVLGMELTDFYTVINTPAGMRGQTRRNLGPNCKTVSLSSIEFYMKANYQDYERMADVDLSLAGDAEASLPTLIEQVRLLVDAGRKSAFQARGQKLAAAHKAAFNRSRQLAAAGWDDSPISVPRMCMELWEQLRHEDWTLANPTTFQSDWPQQLWTADRHHNLLGVAGGAGQGYTAPASLGAALANKRHGRITVAMNGDGDLMFGPGILWTAAHEKIPILYLVHNNRAWHQETMLVQTVANRRERGIDRVKIGTAITDPNIDYAKMAQSMGVFAIGPVTNPADLGPAIKKAMAVVKAGEPALIDVVSQGR